MNEPETIAGERTLFAVIFQQNWENARHIKGERMWFMNVYSIIAAGILSLLHSVEGKVVLEYSLIVFMCVFSLIGLLTSFRLKAELEECLHRIQEMAVQDRSECFLAMGESEGALTRYPKFRWIFPLFYSIATFSFVALLAYRVANGPGSGLVK
jgi:hypothetical protein